MRTTLLLHIVAWRSGPKTHMGVLNSGPVWSQSGTLIPKSPWEHILNP